MSLELILKPGPQYYQYGQDAIDTIPTLLNEYLAKNVLILHGTISWEKAKPYFEKTLAADFNFYFEQYHGECSYREAKRISDLIKEKEIDFVIGVGGGKMCDLTMLSTSYTMTPFGVTPTLSSNCAPWAALSVMYKDNGLAEGHSEHQNHNAAFLITDPRLVIDSPKRYFIAGMADTITKWYEADLVTAQPHVAASPFVQMGRKAAEICKDVILDRGEQAVKDMEAGTLTDDFIHVSEVVIAISGLVGGLGGKYARNTAAHTVHDALSAVLPGIHDYLHGEKVAYGIFYQLALEDKWSEIDRLIPFYKNLNLPLSLTEMNLYPFAPDDREKIIEIMDNKEKLHLLPLEMDKELLANTYDELEKYLTKFE